MREQRDAELTAKIIVIRDESTQTYGWPRVHHELLDQGEFPQAGGAADAGRPPVQPDPETME